jgi:hypothetical protein
MKTRTVLKLTLLLAAFLTIYANSDLSKNAPKIMGVSVKSEKKRLIPLLDLEKKAAETLKQKYPNFDPATVPDASFDPNSSKEFLTLTYFGRVGQPYWTVCFDKKLRITVIETATVTGH